MMDRKKIFTGWVILLSWTLLTAFAPEKVPWKEIRGDHFIVFHFGEDSFAQEVLRKAEQYYKQIGEDLGYERRSGFWQWNHRARIYIYKTKEDFHENSRKAEWSEGYANYAKRTIVSYEWKTDFLESLLPHEITHLIFRDYVGFQGEVPIWLDEGVAQWEEPAKRHVVRSIMRVYLESGRGYSLQDLTTVDVRNISAKPAVEIFYVQAASIVDFLIAKYGSDSFIYFCRQLRDGKSIGAALPFAYPTQMRSIKEMEEKWKAYIHGGS
ncbi:MAG: peptidase MA family metallohydrolase [Candidatus Omnitrophota bacterium]